MRAGRPVRPAGVAGRRRDGDLDGRVRRPRLAGCIRGVLGAAEGATRLRPARGRRRLPRAGRSTTSGAGWPTRPGSTARCCWSRYDGRLTLAVPGTAYSAPTACCEAVGRLAKAVGVRPGNFVAAPAARRPSSRPRRAGRSGPGASPPVGSRRAQRDRAADQPHRPGKGRGARSATWRCRGCAEAGFAVRSLVGRDADEALDLARAVRRRRRRQPWSWSAATAWSTSRVQALAGTATRARHHPGRHRQRRGALLRPARARTPLRRRRGDRAGGPGRIDLARQRADVLRHRAGRRLRRGRQRARQRDDLAARARCATTSPRWPSCGSSSRCRYMLELDGGGAPARGDAGRGRQRAVVRRRPADHRGRLARRRPARRGDHQADRASSSWSGPTRSCSRAPTSRIRSTSTTGSARSRVAAPGIVAYADGERLGAAAR